MSRNTAPAFALAMQACRDDPVLLFLPSDHLITDPQAFAAGVRKAAAHAERGAFVTFGIEPTRPETAYGYIIAAAGADDGVRKVSSFKEKPDRAQAGEYLAGGDCYWNSGIFMCRAGTYRSALEKHAPDVMRACAAAWKGKESDYIMNSTVTTFDAGDFGASPDVSVDYAVVEKLSDIVVVPVACGWSDLGSWDSMTEVFDRGGDGNFTAGDVLAHDSRANIVYASHRCVALCGVANQIVAETPDAVLVADRSDSQAVKRLVEKMKTASRSESEWGRKVYRPWGSYESIDAGDGFQVKRLVVHPGQSLSLQRHRKRSEHWVVVKGVARVTRGDESFDLCVNQSVCIPVGTKHRLANHGERELCLIEVQCGDYLGEDDIERFDDVYGRA